MHFAEHDQVCIRFDPMTFEGYEMNPDNQGVVTSTVTMDSGTVKQMPVPKTMSIR